MGIMPPSLLPVEITQIQVRNVQGKFGILHKNVALATITTLMSAQNKLRHPVLNRTNRKQKAFENVGRPDN